MEILFLGTGAADWKIEKRIAGEEFRRYSSALIDGDLLIDPGPHIFDFAEMNGTPDLYKRLKYVIVTHSHPDHISIDSMLRLILEYGAHMYASEWTVGKFRKAVSERADAADIEEYLHTLEVYETANIGDYAIKPVRSNHATGIKDEKTFNYCISKDGKTVLYGLDGAWFLKEAYREIRDTYFDAMVLEATVGDDDMNFRIFEHNTINMVVMLKNMFINNKLADEKTVFIASHLAKTLHASHEETAKIFDKFGIIVAYDGYIAQI